MSTPAIEVKGLVKRFDDVVAVDGIDLQIAQGECVGLLGPNGAGKTTTVEILEGLLPPSAGEVCVLGRSWATQAEEIRPRIGVALQETRFYEKLTVRETIELFRSFYRSGLEVDEAARLVQLEEKARAQVGKLSGGQRQRLALAVALVAEPELLFLDEPTTGLDPQSRRAMWDIIDSLKGRGRTVVLTTHYMEEAQVLCDRVVIVDHGKVVAQGTPAALIASLGGEQIIEFCTEPRLDPASLHSLPSLVRVREKNGGALLSVRELHVALPALLLAASQEGTRLVELSTRHATLDDVFLNLTGHSLREEQGP
ncbi:MAG: ABC transporter ATP-binding protein [Myxococcales bacterium]|nr:ABC transporter ATP-binding protein [Myxococcales bacterium]